MYIANKALNKILADANEKPLFSINASTRQLDSPDTSPLGTTINRANELLKALADVRTKEAYTFLAHQLKGPIFDVARYEAYTSRFFMPSDGSPGEVIKVPLWKYSGFAVKSSGNGQAVYNTTIKNLYTGPTWQEHKTACAINWDTAAYAGWDVLGRMIQEAGWELARQKDISGKAVMDTATGVVSNHQQTSAGSMTKAAVDNLIKNAYRTGFPIRMAAINGGTAMDIGNWVWPASNNIFWRFDGKSSELWNNLWVNGYGGFPWLLSKDVPVATVYFAGLPDTGGYHWQTPIRQVFHQDYEHDLDKYNFMQRNSWMYVNNINIYSLTIS